MISMTGYGSSQHKDRRLELEVHIKSVNGRFLELRFHLPKEYAPHENEFRQLFQEWSRGTVDVYVHRRPAAEARLQTMQLNIQNARHWAKQLKALNKSLGLDSPVQMRDVLQMPFVMEHQDRQALAPAELKQVEKQIQQAIVRCQKLRKQEGRVLSAELERLLKALNAEIDKMEGWREEATKASQQRLKARLSTMQSESALDASRLAVETALLIDKMDVHEEMVRLKEHVKSCRELVAKGDARGKKLDFYCQELLREVNTIGSKSQLASLTQVVVDAKSIIEKFREQVQNVE